MAAKVISAKRSSKLDGALDALLGKYDTLSARINNLEFSIYDIYPRISVRGCYLTFRDGLPTVEDFVSVIHDRITNFCLPRDQLKAAHELASKASPSEAATIWTSLVTKATQQFIKAKKGSHRSGEAAEVILFILTEWILKAPQIVSKMYLKTNHDMPVHGTDGIHAKYDPATQTLILYWGESKAHKTLTGAVADAISSIETFVSLAKEEKELDLVHAHIDLGDMDDAGKAAILDYLNPYSMKSNQRQSRFSCLLIFDKDSLNHVTDDQAAFEVEFRVEAKKFIDALKPKLEAKGLFPKRFDFFLIPINSVQKLRDAFQQKIGWPK